MDYSKWNFLIKVYVICIALQWTSAFSLKFFTTVQKTKDTNEYIANGGYDNASFSKTVMIFIISALTFKWIFGAISLVSLLAFTFHMPPPKKICFCSLMSRRVNESDQLNHKNQRRVREFVLTSKTLERAAWPFELSTWKKWARFVQTAGTRAMYRFLPVPCTSRYHSLCLL